MDQKTALTYLTTTLARYRLNSHIIKESDSFENVDKGIRNFLGLGDVYNKTAKHMKNILKANTIYKVTDDFLSDYLILQLPDSDISTYLVIGPYTEYDFSKGILPSLIEKYQVPPSLTERLIEYYINIPYISDEAPVRILVETFAELIWNDPNNYSYEELHYFLAKDYIGTIPESILENITESQDISFKMHLLEERYQIEKNLITYVSQGNYMKALSSLSGINHLIIENRAAFRLQDYRNYSIILNTLLRKGAELGSVHPIYIDRLSSYFARKIETITSLEQGTKLFKEMIRKYCLLVKNNSLKDYSLLIQKVITRIEADLTADQSLKTHAHLLNVNSSYLSSLFRKETGFTLTEYVNHKRIEHSIFLLNTTEMQIQTVAQYCGINDINYFTRIFKKQIGKTPSEYKKLLRRTS